MPPRGRIPSGGHELTPELVGTSESLVHTLPRITLVTPSLNQGSFIAGTIESVGQQRYANLEYLVIDGGSCDQTRDVVNRYSSIVTDYVSEADRGQADAINKGFARGSGEIFCWLNADDLLEPGTLETIGRLYQRGGFSFVYGDGWKLRDGGTRRRRIRPGTIDQERLKVRDTILQPSTFWSREVAQRVADDCRDPPTPVYLTRRVTVREGAPTNDKS